MVNFSTLTLPTPPLSPPSSLQHYEYIVCKVSYKSKSGLTHHNNIIQKYNIAWYNIKVYRMIIFNL